MTLPEATAQPAACPSCGAPPLGAYCKDCGEKLEGAADLRLSALLKEAFHFQTHLDNRVVTTLGHLLRRPGSLTRAWAEGRRREYAKPIQLFVVVNLVFFLFSSSLGILLFTLETFTPGKGLPGVSAERLMAKQAELGFTAEQMVRAVNHGLDPHKKWLFLLLIPLTALVLWALHPRRRIAEHFVFAIHHACFLLILMLALGGIGRLSMAAGADLLSFRILALATLLLLLVHAARALRRVYGGGPAWAAARALLVVAVFIPAILLAERLAYFLAVRGL
jgi:hypothetical protein